MCTDREGYLSQHEWLNITEARSLFRNLCHCQGAKFLAFETLRLSQFTFPGLSSTIISHSSLPQSTLCFSLRALPMTCPFLQKPSPHSLLPNQILPHWGPAQIPPAPVPPLAQTISRLLWTHPTPLIRLFPRAVHWAIFHLMAWPQEREWMRMYRLLPILSSLIFHGKHLCYKNKLKQSDKKSIRKFDKGKNKLQSFIKRNSLLWEYFKKKKLL